MELALSRCTRVDGIRRNFYCVCVQRVRNFRFPRSFLPPPPILFLFFLFPYGASILSRNLKQRYAVSQGKPPHLVNFANRQGYSESDGPRHSSTTWHAIGPSNGLMLQCYYRVVLSARNINTKIYTPRWPRSTSTRRVPQSY